MTETNIIVVHEGHRFYKEDGTDDFIEVTPGNAVQSGNNVYVVESDYNKIKQYYDQRGSQT